MSTRIDHIVIDDLPPIQELPEAKKSWGSKLVEWIKSSLGFNASRVAIAVLKSQFGTEIGKLEKLSGAINLSYSKERRTEARRELMQITASSYDSMALSPIEKADLKGTLLDLQERHKTDAISDGNMERHIVSISLKDLEDLSSALFTAQSVDEQVHLYSELFGLKSRNYESENLSEKSQTQLKNTLAYLQELHREFREGGDTTSRSYQEQLWIGTPFSAPIFPEDPIALVENIRALGPTDETLNLIKQRGKAIRAGNAGAELDQVIMEFENQLHERIAARAETIPKSEREVQNEQIRFDVSTTLDAVQQELALSEVMAKKALEVELIDARLNYLNAQYSENFSEVTFEEVKYSQIRDKMSDQALITQVESATIEELSEKKMIIKSQMQEGYGPLVLAQTGHKIGDVFSHKSSLSSQRAQKRSRQVVSYERDPLLTQILKATHVRLEILEAEEALQNEGGYFTSIPEAAYAVHDAKLMNIRAEALMNGLSEEEVEKYISQAENSSSLEKEIITARSQVLQFTLELEKSAKKVIKTVKVKRVQVREIENPNILLTPVVQGLYNRVQSALKKLKEIDPTAAQEISKLPLKKMRPQIVFGSPARATKIFNALLREQDRDKALLAGLKSSAFDSRAIH